MGLFGPSRPKGITKDELYFVRGELMAKSGVGIHLTKLQAEDIVEKLSVAMDPDSYAGRQHHWEQADAEEVEKVEELAENNRGMHFSDGQQERIHAVLQKYLDINKVRSFF